jgi:hypothetical protein
LEVRLLLDALLALMLLSNRRQLDCLDNASSASFFRRKYDGLRVSERDRICHAPMKKADRDVVRDMGQCELGIPIAARSDYACF